MLMRIKISESDWPSKVSSKEVSFQAFVTHDYNLLHQLRKNPLTENIGYIADTFLFWCIYKSNIRQAPVSEHWSTIKASSTTALKNFIIMLVLIKACLSFNVLF